MAAPILAYIAQKLLELKKRNEKIEGVDNGAQGAINPLQFLSTLGSKKQGNQIIHNDNIHNISKKVGESLAKAKDIFQQKQSFQNF